MTLECQAFKPEGSIFYDDTNSEHHVSRMYSKKQVYT